VKRKHISLKTKLAACLLAVGDIPYEDAKHMTAEQILRLYQFDHYPVLHAHGGPDEPWNLRPMLRGPHKEKSRKDCGIAAKVKRLQRQFRPEMVGGMVALIEVVDRQMPRQARGKANGESFAPAKPKHRIAQRARPWPPKGSRPMRWKDAPWPTK
jgi:hypothetical protein